MLLVRKWKRTVWMDKSGFGWVRIDAEVSDTITWGFYLFRLSQGARFELHQSLVNGEVWLPRYSRVAGCARIALVKKLNLEQEMTFKNFRKFQSDSQLVSTTGP